MTNLVIWKAPLGVSQDRGYPVNMPEGADVLSVAAQGDELMVWFRCDPAKPIKQRRLLVIGTGIPGECPAADEARFIGTVLMMGGRLVLHVFEPV